MANQSYERYMNSAAWRAKRQEYRASGRPTTCVKCGSKDIQFHHRTYKRFTKEHLDDLVPLCQVHHSALHLLQKERKIGVTEATAIYLNERRPAVKTKKPKPRPAKRKPTAQQKELAKMVALMEREGVKAAVRQGRVSYIRPAPLHIEPPRTEDGLIRSKGRRPKRRRATVR